MITTMTKTQTATFIALSTTALLIAPDLAHAASANSASDVFNTGPLDNIIDFLTGPVARFIAVLAVFALGAMIMFGQGFQGFGQRVPTVLIGIIFVIGAVTAVDFFIGGSSGASLTPEEFLEIQDLGHLDTGKANQ